MASPGDRQDPGLRWKHDLWGRLLYQLPHAAAGLQLANTGAVRCGMGPGWGSKASPKLGNLSLKNYGTWGCGWWFGTFVIFPYIGNNHPNWLSYFCRGVGIPPTRDSTCGESESPTLKWMVDDGRGHFPIS